MSSVLSCNRLATESGDEGIGAGALFELGGAFSIFLSKSNFGFAAEGITARFFLRGTYTGGAHCSANSSGVGGCKRRSVSAPKSRLYFAFASSFVLPFLTAFCFSFTYLRLGFASLGY